MLLRPVDLPGGLRLALSPPGTRRAVVDGVWWPYSTWLTDQVPQLLTLFETAGAPARRVIVHAADWTGRPRDVAVGARLVPVHRLATLFPHMMFLEGGDGRRTDLLVIPPGTEPAVADIAMAMATDPGNTVPAPRIVAAATARAARRRYPRPPAG